MDKKEVRKIFSQSLLLAGVVVLPFWFLMGLMTFSQEQKQPLVNGVSVVVWLLLAYLFTRVRMKD